MLRFVDSSPPASADNAAVDGSVKLARREPTRVRSAREGAGKSTTLIGAGCRHLR